MSPPSCAQRRADASGGACHARRWVVGGVEHASTTRRRRPAIATTTTTPTARSGRDRPQRAGQPARRVRDDAAVQHADRRAVARGRSQRRRRERPDLLRPDEPAPVRRRRPHRRGRRPASVGACSRSRVARSASSRRARPLASFRPFNRRVMFRPRSVAASSRRAPAHDRPREPVERRGRRPARRVVPAVRPRHGRVVQGRRHARGSGRRARRRRSRARRRVARRGVTSFLTSTLPTSNRATGGCATTTHRRGVGNLGVSCTPPWLQNAAAHTDWRGRHRSVRDDGVLRVEPAHRRDRRGRRRGSRSCAACSLHRPARCSGAPVPDRHADGARRRPDGTLYYADSGLVVQNAKLVAGPAHRHDPAHRVRRRQAATTRGRRQRPRVARRDRDLDPESA